MLVDVALPLPMPRTFTYRVDGGAPPGTRVLVPFGRKRYVGWVVGLSSEQIEPDRVRSVVHVLDPESAVPQDLLDLARWVGDYYIAPLGQVLRTALPVLLSAPGRPEPPVRSRRVVRLVRELPSIQLRDELFGRANRQRECYEVLEALGGSAELAYLTGTAGFSSTVIQGLLDKAVAESVDEIVERDPFADIAAEVPPALVPMPAQAAVLADLVAASQTAGDSRPFLLRGVTGSGKTLVYIELLREVVERQGRGAIVLVPEIALTPQTVSRFRAHFGDSIAVLHSALSDGERYDAWRALRSGQKRIAVGARSAIFAPVRELGAIVVDEEHEGTYKQSDIEPRYHAREVAVVRAGQAGAVCLLGSATPSLESWYNVQQGKYRLLELPERVEGRPMPPVRLIDLRAKQTESLFAPTGPGASAARSAMDPPREPQQIRSGGGPAALPERSKRPILSAPLIDAIHDRMQRGEQTILLLNRRGYSTFVQCSDCGEVWHCPQCNVSLTYHRRRQRLVCHYCQRDEPAPVTCDRCGSSEVNFRGVGTEQVERTVMETFPDARIARMDVDTMSGKWAHHRILERVGSGEVDILLGTQMIAKGLDFPNVTLVGVINADVGLNLPDFRAAERTFQLVTQVAGRAGRGPRGGEVLVQTAMPKNYAIQASVAHDYAGFAARELEERESPEYPPHCRLANIVVSGLDENAVQHTAEDAAAWLRALLLAHGVDTVRITGPAPCAIDRVRGRWRWHFIVRANGPKQLGEACRRLHEDYTVRGGAAEMRLAIDRDPVALL